MEKINLVREMTEEEKQDLANQTARKNGDKYKYLILFKGEYKDDGSPWKDWELVQGRQSAYDMIKELLIGQDDLETDIIIDVSESYIISQPPVITENTPRITFDNMLSVFKFMQTMLIKNLIVDESSFCIEDYYDGE